MARDEELQRVVEQKSLQCLTTEHFTLQGAKSATIAEAHGRTSMFLSAVSAGVVALAFIGQVSGMSRGFFAFALVLLPGLFFVGVATFVRVVQTAIEIVTMLVTLLPHRRYQMRQGDRAAEVLPVHFPTPVDEGLSPME